MSDHWPGCYNFHPGCAAMELARVQAENVRLRALLVPCGDDCLTHQVVVPLHGEGPTWAHRTDDPPCR